MPANIRKYVLSRLFFAHEIQRLSARPPPPGIFFNLVAKIEFGRFAEVLYLFLSDLDGA
jgi:hypothetical protein